MTMDNMPAVNGWPTWSHLTVERLIKTLPPIEDIWAALPDPAAIGQLKQRENLLGVATLSWRSFELIHEIVSHLGAYNAIVRHPPSVKACTKQALLNGLLSSAALLVNKTVTVRLHTQHFLLTGVGDFTINRHLLHQVAEKFQLPRRVAKACRINPTDYSPESELGLQAGIVSPFISPSVSRNRLRGIVLFIAMEIDPMEERMIAISLSPFESLVVRLADFHALAHLYARRAYPDLHWTKIHG